MWPTPCIKRTEYTCEYKTDLYIAFIGIINNKTWAEPSTVVLHRNWMKTYRLQINAKCNTVDTVSNKNVNKSDQDGRSKCFIKWHLPKIWNFRLLQEPTLFHINKHQYVNSMRMRETLGLQWYEYLSFIHSNCSNYMT